MRNRLIALACLMVVFTLSGCSQNDTESVDMPSESPIQSTQPETTINKNKDNMSSPEENYYYQIESTPNIKSDIVEDTEKIKFKKPYSTTNKAWVTPEETEEIKGTEENLDEPLEEPSQSPEEVENTFDTEIGQEENVDNIIEEVIDEQIPQGPSEEEIAAFNKKKLAYEINHSIMYETYQNGILLLDNVKSEKDFNSMHRVTLRVVFENTQKNLENIENIGNNLSQNFSSNEKLIKAWDSIYKELSNYRKSLNLLNDCTEVIDKKDELSSTAIRKLIYDFSDIISIEIGDYKPEMQIQTTSDYIDNTSEVGES